MALPPGGCRRRVLPVSHRRVVLALAACAQLPAGARAQDCTVAGLSGVDNGVLGAACQPSQTLTDGTSCSIACLTGYTRSGVQPSCAGGVFEPGSIVCCESFAACFGPSSAIGEDDTEGMAQFVLHGSTPGAECSGSEDVDRCAL
jgi:hypothetical protein